MSQLLSTSIPPSACTPHERQSSFVGNGPNALPEEKPKPGWRRFLDQYRSYMQLILVGAASCHWPSRSGAPPCSWSSSRSSTRWWASARKGRRRAR